MLVPCVLHGSIPADEWSVDMIARSKLETILKQGQIPGLGVCIVHGDEAFKIEVAGVRKADGTDRITVDDLFHIGSCTKFMTTCLVHMGISEGKLTWDATVEKLTESLQ